MSQYSIHTDEQLITLLKCGDEAAFTEIYDRYWNQLYKSACRKKADKEQAKEIVHDVFLDIWKRRESLNISYLPAYLEQAVRFRLINYINRNKIPTFFDLFETLLFSPYEADQVLKQKDFIKLLEGWVDILPETQRRIFIQYFLKELSVKEIAVEMNLSPKTIQNNLSLSLRHLRTRFGTLVAILHFFI